MKLPWDKRDLNEEPAACPEYRGIHRGKNIIAKPDRLFDKIESVAFEYNVEIIYLDISNNIVKLVGVPANVKGTVLDEFYCDLMKAVGRGVDVRAKLLNPLYILSYPRHLLRRSDRGLMTMYDAEDDSEAYERR